MILSGVLCVLLVATGVAGDLEEAKRAADALEYTRADTILMEVITDPDASEAQLIQAHTLKGVVQLIMGNDTAARLSFLFVLKRRPGAALPSGTPPKVVTFFELIREELSVARPAGTAGSAIVIDAKPRGDVWVGGQLMGPTPVRAAGPPGSVRVIVQSGEHRATFAAERVAAGDTNVNVELAQPYVSRT
jgi:hypothetical protein